ncbi:unnamed protein product [Rangifer tarandus platyrhynchus]|uniref:Uncharacterized protein n=1 Tax=Rangifer tarandus platyrhynchus TaxID=3082113 RepID=A0AC59ZRU7_RANTA
MGMARHNLPCQPLYTACLPMATSPSVLSWLLLPSPHRGTHSYSSVIPVPGFPPQCLQHFSCLPPPRLSPPALALVSLGNVLGPGEALKGRMVLHGQIFPTIEPPILAP